MDDHRQLHEVTTRHLRNEQFKIRFAIKRQTQCTACPSLWRRSAHLQSGAIYPQATSDAARAAADPL